MNPIKAALHELLGLFVEDGAFALAIVGVVALACILAVALPRLTWVAGVILLFGCLAALVAGIAGAAAKVRRS